MHTVVMFDGMRDMKSSKGRQYALVYGRSVNPTTGKVEFEQKRISAFSPQVIADIKQIKQGKMVILDLEVKDAIVRGVEVYEEED